MIEQYCYFTNPILLLLTGLTLLCQQPCNIACDIFTHVDFRLLLVFYHLRFDGMGFLFAFLVGLKSEGSKKDEIDLNQKLSEWLMLECKLTSI